MMLRGWIYLNSRRIGHPIFTDVRKRVFNAIIGTGSCACMTGASFHGIWWGKSVCCAGKVIVFLIIGSEGGKKALCG